MVFRGLHHYLGKAINDAIKQAGWELWEETPYKDRNCVFCGKFVKHRDRSIDHIVPESVIKELGLAGLLYDKRNFRIAHKICNRERGDNTDDLPEAVLAKLRVLGYSR